MGVNRFAIGGAMCQNRQKSIYNGGKCVSKIMDKNWSTIGCVTVCVKMGKNRS